MTIKIGEKEIELAYTYNSFKYMQDLDLSALMDIETKPFMILSFAETLLNGALNSDPKVKFSESVVQAYLTEYIESGSLVDFVQELMELLTESGFFKSLQKSMNQEK